MSSDKTPLAVIREELGWDAADNELFFGMDLDSLEFTELTVTLERAFQVEFTDFDIARVQTVGDLCALVDRLRNYHAAN